MADRGKILLLALMLALALAGCAKGGDVFPDLGDNIAAPSAIWIDVASNRLYLNNSNSKVLYDSTQGNFQVYDITAPLAPVLLDTVQTMSFNGQLYVDPVAKIAWTPNRYSANVTVSTGLLYGINIDEASPDFLGLQETTIDANSFGLACCYPANRAWIPNELPNGVGTQELQYADLGAGTATMGAIPLTTALDNGAQLTQAQSSYVAIIGNQAFLSRIYGGIMVVNLDKAGVAGSVPVDYFISDIEAPYGIAADVANQLLYVAGQGNNANGDWINYLLILDVSSLTPRTGNTTTAVIDKEESGLLLAMIEVGNNPYEVALSTQYAFVTNANDDTVSVINVNTRAVVATIPVQDEPFTMALYRTLGGVDQYLYVANDASNTLSIIDIPTLTVAATYP